MIQSWASAFPDGTGPIRDGVKGIELSADCIAGVYVHGSGYADSEVEAAFPLTALHDSPARIAAFHAGMAASKPDSCITNYER